ncbi:ABC transporter substrate-binding protein [Klebsiella pneumoniae]|uniref:ABC transporter substrate-binding protein n=1 Tax=Klebsiella pneumoniae TaxID=573 RepID=UPI000B9C0407|nr:ABC transporter substrate-binding protein [Klebsiella pneumoniae]HDT1329260.1 ABC transporter substrate-binding protein [Klebsiella pneumoniae subsp. pneumoniae]AVW76526.1 ABC transporter substrate-binding protein [Klebsiella pneumoniae]MCM6708282.1 ABC transporter substrate-binding protein [Klebsiella pneumoniae]MCX0259473.1 ABC transporter substrate-binding protein [Klebsiella pneumoniae]MCX0280384.1 ABC transporter substrate-binding protein [Klebsiella pneumoniae]
MSRLQQGLKTRQTRFALALKVALLGGVVAFSSVAHAEVILKEGITPATDASQIPASAKLRTDTVVAGISEPQGIFNPYFFVNGWDENVTNVIFSRLIDWDSQGKLVPGLAESWTVSPDNKVYTIKLRPGLTFSDGSPLTAEDVAFTLTVLLDPSYDGDTDITLANIAGGADYKAGKADSVSGLKVIDPLTLQVTTTQPGATTLAKIGGPVLSKAWYGKGYQRGNLDYLRSLHGKPLGNGPYVYDKYIPGQEIRFHANSHFYRGTPPTPRFIYRVTNPSTNFQLFQTGETDYDAFTSRPDDIEQLKMLGFANINLYGSSDYSQVEFNVHRPALQDKRVRQALIYGLDRQKLIDVVYQGYGKVAIEPIAPISWAFNAEGVNPYPYDPAQAKKLLDEAGWKPGADGIRAKDGQRLELTLLVSKKVLNDALIPIAKENWRQIGVLLKPQVVDFNALMAQRKAGNYDLASFSTSTLNDPHDGVWDFYSSEAKESGYHNAEVDKLINAGNAVLDIEQSKPIYHQLYKVLADDPPVILLGYREILSASSARVSGFKPDIYNGLTGSLPDVKIVK